MTEKQYMRQFLQEYESQMQHAFQQENKRPLYMK